MAVRVEGFAGKQRPDAPDPTLIFRQVDRLGASGISVLFGFGSRTAAKDCTVFCHESLLDHVAGVICEGRVRLP